MRTPSPQLTSQERTTCNMWERIEIQVLVSNQSLLQMEKNESARLQKDHPKISIWENEESPHIKWIGNTLMRGIVH
jgi:hypothetical protein